MNLYIIQFGGTRSGTLFEAHDVRTAFGETLDDAVATIREGVRTALKAAHIDGYAEVMLKPEPASDEAQLFLVETGANGPAMFEQHGYEFVWATNAREAQGKTVRPVHRCHIDTVFNVSRAARGLGFSVPRFDPFGSEYQPLQKPFYKRV